MELVCLWAMVTQAGWQTKCREVLDSQEEQIHSLGTTLLQILPQEISRTHTSIVRLLLKVLVRFRIKAILQEINH